MFVVLLEPSKLGIKFISSGRKKLARGRKTFKDRNKMTVISDTKTLLQSLYDYNTVGMTHASQGDSGLGENPDTAQLCMDF